MGTESFPGELPAHLAVTSEPGMYEVWLATDPEPMHFSVGPYGHSVSWAHWGRGGFDLEVFVVAVDMPAILERTYEEDVVVTSAVTLIVQVS